MEVRENDITIRRATEADINAIARVHVDASRVAYKGIYTDVYLNSLTYEDRAQRWIDTGSLNSDDPRVAVFVACKENQIVGFAHVEIANNQDIEQLNGRPIIKAMYVDPNYFGKGVGYTLFQTCIKHFKDQGFTECVLDVISRNARARHFYERQGGKVVPESEKIVKTRSGTEEAIIAYEWVLI